MHLTSTIAIFLVVSLLLLLINLVVAVVALLFGGGFKVFFTYGLWSLLVPVLFLVYGFVARYFPKVEKVEIVSEKIPAQFDGYKIVQFSDLHVSSFLDNKGKMAKVVEIINEQGADLILFTGDIVSNSASELDGFMEILKGLEAVDGVYSVLGNHDYLLYREWSSEEARLDEMDMLVSYQQKLGWRVLRDENVTISRGDSSSISIIGVENISAGKHFNTEGDLSKAMVGAEGSFKILLSHDPSHWRSGVIDKTDIDLTLSGHTHAMQFSILGYSPVSMMYEEYRGLYQEGDQALYVNIGIGETGPLFRIGTPPEVTLFTLHSK